MGIAVFVSVFGLNGLNEILQYVFVSEVVVTLAIRIVSDLSVVLEYVVCAAGIRLPQVFVPVIVVVFPIYLPDIAGAVGEHMERTGCGDYGRSIVGVLVHRDLDGDGRCDRIKVDFRHSGGSDGAEVHHVCCEFGVVVYVDGLFVGRAFVYEYLPTDELLILSQGLLHTLLCDVQNVHLPLGVDDAECGSDAYRRVDRDLDEFSVHDGVRLLHHVICVVLGLEFGPGAVVVVEEVHLNLDT